MPYQKDLLSTFDGYKPGEMMLISASRQTGKSLFTQYVMNDIFKLQPNFEIVTGALVDGVQWHTVAVSGPVATWIRSKNKQQWSEHSVRGSNFRSMFDMDEKLYTMLAIKFS